MVVYRKVIKPMVKKHNVRDKIQEFVRRVKSIVEDLRGIFIGKQKKRSRKR